MRQSLGRGEDTGLIQADHEHSVNAASSRQSYNAATMTLRPLGNFVVLDGRNCVSESQPQIYGARCRGSKR